MDFTELFETKLDELIITEMDKTNCPATTLAIVENGEIEFTRAYGASNFEINRPTDPDTLFCVASVTKSFICAGIMKLQEQEKLSVDDPISEYLPITIGYDDPITIHHLMTHTSGIPNLADNMWYRNKEDEWDIDQPIPRFPFSSWDDGFRFLNGSQEYLSKPGERFHYNNFGYGLLSKIITEVAGISFKQYIRDHIFNPLDMKRTGFYNEIKDDGKLATAYRSIAKSDTRQFVEMGYDEIRLTRSLDEAAGGLFSTVKELTHYMMMLLNEGQYNGMQVLTTNSVKEMTSRQFEEDYPNSAFAGMYGQKISGYGYGFAIDEGFHGTKLIQHSGSFIGASAWFAFLPTKQRGVCILSNHHPSPRMFAQAILIESLGLDCEEDWDLLKLRDFHDKLTGTYETYKGLNTIKVTSSSGQLFVSNIDGSNSRGLIPYDDHPYTLNYFEMTEVGGKLPAQFIHDEHTWLVIERNKWRKINGNT